MIRKLAAVAFATSVVAVAAPASAQESSSGGARPMGLRFETAFNKNFNLVGIGNGQGETNISTTPSPQGDIKVGYDFGQLTPLIGIGFATNTTGVGDAPNATETALVLDVELRYYLKPHRKGLSPFVFGEWNKAFVWISNEDESEAQKDLNEAAADVADFWSLNAGLGMEYKFDGAAFAIGGKWGLGLGFKGTSKDHGDSSDTTFGTSAAIYAAWRI